MPDKMSVAAMNPCPCGYYGHLERKRTCSHQTVTRYQKRISGPMLNRIDIHIEVPHVDLERFVFGLRPPDKGKERVSLVYLTG